MTKDQLIEQYRKELAISKNKKETLKNIYEKIKEINYTGTNRKISLEDRIYILENIHSKILKESNVYFASDNKELLELISLLISEEKKNGK